MTLTVIVLPAFLALTTTPSIAPSLAEDTWPVSAAGACAYAARDSIKGSAVAAAAVVVDQPVRIVASDGNSVLVSSELGVADVLTNAATQPFRLLRTPAKQGLAGAPYR